MTVTRIGPMSVAKIAGALYALIGLIAGGVISAVSMVGGAMGGSEAGALGMLFGAAAVVLIPVLYGCLGFVMTLIGASLFNFVAGMVGGVELETR